MRKYKDKDKQNKTTLFKTHCVLIASHEPPAQATSKVKKSLDEYIPSQMPNDQTKHINSKVKKGETKNL